MNLCRCEKGHFYDKEKYATCPHCAGGSAADNSLTAAFTEEMIEPVTQPGSPGDAMGLPPMPGDSTERYEQTDLPLPDKMADEVTQPLQGPYVDPPTMPLTAPQPIQPTIPLDIGGEDDDDHTIGIYDDFFSSPVTPPPAGNMGMASPGRAPVANKVSTPCVGWLIALGGEHIGTDFRLKTGKNFIGRSTQMDVALTEDKSVSRDRHAIVVYEPKAHLYLVQPGESSSLVYKNDEVVLTPMKLEAYDVITVGDVNLLFMPLCGARFNWGDLIKKMRNEG